MHPFASAIYTGKVRHRRFSPKQNWFEYSVFMMYLDTSEIEEIFSLSSFWSLKHFAPVQFKRNDFHISKEPMYNQAKDSETNNISSLDDAVRSSVYAATGMRLTGPIRMLVNLRYWGFNMNPISTYYCFDESGENLVAILAEVHNTPWDERHAYIFINKQSPDKHFAKKQHLNFKKQFHVSPFNPIDMDYRWYSTTPGENLTLHLENWESEIKIMDATMTLQREAITAASLNKILIRFPWMTVKIISAIYWQALKLWWKGVPIFDHESPGNNIESSPIPIIKMSNRIQEDK